MYGKHNSLEHLHNPYIFLSQIGYVPICDLEPNVCDRDMHLIHYVESGNGTFEIAGKKFNLKPGDIFYIPPFQHALFTTNPTNRLSLCYFAFNGSYSVDLVQNSIFKGNCYVSHLSETQGKELYKQVSSAAESISNSLFPSLYGNELLFKLLQFITIPPQRKNMNSSAVCVEAAKNHIKQHYSEDIKISELASKFNITRSHFFRIFKLNMGISPIEYVTMIRMQQAKKLLSSSNIPIGKIANLSGYSCYTTFYLMFQKNTGITPQEYRLLLKSSSSAPETNSKTSIRIFQDINECSKLDKYKVSSLSTSGDTFFVKSDLLAHYAARLKYNLKSYSFFAYVFTNYEDAKKYFIRATGSAPANDDMGFKFKSNSSRTELVILKNNHAYRLIGDDLLEFNTFRHIVNQAFSIILIN